MGDCDVVLSLKITLRPQDDVEKCVDIDDVCEFLKQQLAVECSNRGMDVVTYVGLVE